MSRSQPPQPRTAPSAQGGRLALDNQLIYDPLGNTADSLPFGVSSRPGVTGPTASLFMAVGSFVPKLDHLTHITKIIAEPAAPAVRSALALVDEADAKD